MNTHKIDHPILGISIILIMAISLSSFIFPTQENSTNHLYLPNHNQIDTLLDKDYDALWEEVTALHHKQKIKDAKVVCQQIYNKAEQEQNDPQMIKALLFIYKFDHITEEDSNKKIVQDLYKRIEKAEQPQKAVLQSILAQLYWQYFLQNNERLSERSQGADDKYYLTWDSDRLLKEIQELYLTSLKPAEILQNIPVNDFAPLIQSKEGSAIYRPTLYDILSHRAINFFKDERSNISKSLDQFQFDDPNIFADVNTFIKHNFKHTDENSHYIHALKIYRDLSQFHLSNKDKKPLLALTLDRLTLAYKNTTLSNKDSLYIIALKTLEEVDPSNSFSGIIIDQQVAFHIEKSHLYNRIDAPEWRYEKQKAFEICQTAIKENENLNTPLTDACIRLIGDLQKKYLAIDLLDKNIPEQAILANVAYKNVKQLFGRSILITDSLKIQMERLRKTGSLVSYEKRIEELLLSQAVVKEWFIDLPDDDLYHSHNAQFKIPPHPVGQYYFLHANNKDFDSEKGQVRLQSTFVTNLSVITDIDPRTKQLKIYTVDSHSGQALGGVETSIIDEIYNHKTRMEDPVILQQIRSDSLGLVVLDVKKIRNYRHNNAIIQLQKDSDHYEFKANAISLNHYGGIGRGKKEHKNIKFFTDRSIYRPGQKVHFKGILYNKNQYDQEYSIIPYQTVKVVLRDVNGQKVEELELVTNEFGSIHGTFELPSHLLNGQFSIGTPSSVATKFQVEEYKRPKFYINLNAEGSLKLNEPVKIVGKAQSYASSNMDQVQVKYHITRQARERSSSKALEIKTGKTTTNENGQFEFSFTAIADNKVNPKDRPVFIYDIIVELTDRNGETQTFSKTVHVGYIALIARVETPEKIDKTAPTIFPVITRNITGYFAAADVHIQIQELVAPNRVFRKSLFQQADTFTLSKEAFIQNFPNDIYDREDQYTNWEKGKIVFDQKLRTTKKSSINIKDLADWNTGTYLLTLKAKDQYGSLVERQQAIKVFSLEEETIPDKEIFWHHFSHESIEPGEVLTIACGSAAKDAHILLSVLFKNQIIEEKWIKVSEAQQLVKIKVKEEWQGNFQVRMAMVKFNRFYHTEKTITVPWSNKKLDIAVKTFRNKLHSGQKEEWTLTIKDQHENQAIAELMTTLYDASLDRLKGHKWSFNLYPNFNRHYNNKQLGMIQSKLEKRNSNIPQNNYWKPLFHNDTRKYDHLNLYGVSIKRAISTYSSYSPTQEIEHIVTASQQADGSLVVNKEVVRHYVYSSMSVTTDTTATSPPSPSTYAKTIPPFQKEEKALTNIKNTKAPPPPIRKNLQETAFFFPDIKTNEQGEFVLSFTSPEALTTWKWMGIAHTKDLKIGTLLEEAVTQKDLMVFPNPPRFFRENDTIWFSAKVSNLIKKTLTGTAKLELFDALTMQPIDTKLANNHPEQNIKLKEGQSDAVSWQLVIPKGIQVVTWRVTAQAGNFTDGEENTLPVLTNRQLVTESIPLNIRGKENKQFTFDNLQKADQSNTLTHQSMTLEFTSQPAWYAIQSLPYLMDLTPESSISTIGSYYANAIAAHIVNTDPNIKKVFESWKAEALTANNSNELLDTEALLSNLEKNQELKNLLLEETPWIRAAKNETERKHRLAALFDIERMNWELKRFEKILQEEQNPDGSWSWYSGMKSDWHITQHIVATLGQLKKMGIKMDFSTNAMLIRAVRYMDQKIYDYYQHYEKPNRIINQNEDNVLRLEANIVHYLYARSFFKDIPMHEDYKEAINFCQKQAGDNWINEHLQVQAMTAIALYRWKDGESPIAKDIMEALRQNAVQNEEMGMYYKANIRKKNYRFDIFSGYWYNSPVETQATIIEAFDEVENDLKTMNKLRTWLLKQKQIQGWKTSTATVKACNALLLRGTNWINSDELVDISIGSQKLDPHNMPEVAVEAGTGYFKKQWQAEAITPDMKNITVSKKDESIGWGAVYWQYFEDLDKITRAETPLSIEKDLFKEVYTKNGPQLNKLADGAALEVGDKVKVRIIIRVDRDIEYVHLKDMRAAAFEPMNVISRYKYQDGLGYYESTKDAATNFFMDRLPKGTYVFEYPLRVAQKGDFSNGITTIQCMYAPEFTSHSEGVRVRVK